MQYIPPAFGEAEYRLGDHSENGEQRSRSDFRPENCECLADPGTISLSTTLERTSYLPPNDSTNAFSLQKAISLELTLLYNCAHLFDSN